MVGDRINQAVENAVGHCPTDISLVCCNDQQNLMIYIGQGGSNTGSIPILPAPKRSTCLPRQALLYRPLDNQSRLSVSFVGRQI